MTSTAVHPTYRELLAAHRGLAAEPSVSEHLAACDICQHVVKFLDRKVNDDFGATWLAERPVTLPNVVTERMVAEIVARPTPVASPASIPVPATTPVAVPLAMPGPPAAGGPRRRRLQPGSWRRVTRPLSGIAAAALLTILVYRLVPRGESISDTAPRPARLDSAIGTSGSAVPDSPRPSSGEVSGASRPPVGRSTVGQTPSSSPAPVPPSMPSGRPRSAPIATDTTSGREPVAALRYFRRALASSRKTDDRVSEGVALHGIATSYQRLGFSDSALHYFRQTLAIRREMGDRIAEAVTLDNIGVVQGELGRPDSALSYHRHALVVARELGDRRAEVTALRRIGNAYAELGSSDSASHYRQAALAAARASSPTAGGAGPGSPVALSETDEGLSIRLAAYTSSMEPRQAQALDSTVSLLKQNPQRDVRIRYTDPSLGRESDSWRLAVRVRGRLALGGVDPERVMLVRVQAVSRVGLPPNLDAIEIVVRPARNRDR